MQHKFFRFLLLLLATISLGIRPSSSSFSKDSCNDNELPAVTNMKIGIDITKFNALTDDDNFCRYVLNLSCESNRTWSNAHVPNRTFLLPDQVAQITLNEANHLHSLRVLWAHDMIDLQNILLSRMSSIKTDNLIGACTQNKYYNQYLQNYYRDNDSFALVTSQISVYDIQLKPPNELILDAEFVDSIKNLPEKYEQSPTEYHKLAERYGTHYISGANLGATNYWIKQIPNRKYIASEKEIEDVLKAKFFMIMDHRELAKIPKNFNKICHDIDCVTYEAGFVLEELIDGLYLIPGYVEYFLRPLEDLFSDEKLKVKMKIASEMYRIDAYLGELRAVYNAANEYYQPSSEDRALLRKVEAFVKANISSINAEEAIQTIDDLYSKVKEKPHLEQLINDYYVTAGLKLQFARSICDLSGGLCTSKVIDDENVQLEQLYKEYESSKAAGNFTREMYHQFGRKVHELSSRFGIRDELHGGLSANCDKC